MILFCVLSCSYPGILGDNIMLFYLDRQKIEQTELDKVLEACDMVIRGISNKY